METKSAVLAPAVGGYDVVAYFDGEAKPGDPLYGVVYDGTTYYFSSPENKSRFEASPEQYLPAYGGFCATAMSEGNLFGVDPTNFLVSNGRLYLFYRGAAGDTRPQWEAEATERGGQADAHWTRLNG